MEIIKANDLLSLKNIILHGGNINGEIDNYKTTPLHCAAHNGHIEIVKCLVDNGAYINAKDICGNTPLHCAAHDGHIEIVKYLIDNGAYINEQDNNLCIPLHWALRRRHSEIAKYLIDNGADVEKKDSDGSTPLHLATDYDTLNNVKCLVKKGADVNVKCGIFKNTALHIVAFKGNVEMCTFLLENGAYFNEKNIFNETPLQIAEKSKQVRIIDKLHFCMFQHMLWECWQIDDNDVII